MEEKFMLKHNSYMIFILNYAPIVVIGTIAVVFFHGKIVNWLEFLAVTAVFIGALWKGLSPLKQNKRFLVITDKNITIGKYKRKQPVVIQQIENESISMINASNINDTGAYLIIKNDKTPEVLEISAGFKPDKELVLKINAAFYKIFGDKFHIENNQEIQDYINTNVVPDEIIKADKNTKGTRIALSCIQTLLSIIPTLLAILAILWLFFMSIYQILTLILKV